MSPEEIDRFSRSLKNLAVLNLSGGEPFLRNDFAKIADILIKNTKPMKVIVASNGSLTEKIISDSSVILKNMRRSHVTFHFSLDGIGEDHDSSRGMRGLFAKVKRTIEEMKKLKKDFSNFNIGILLTVTPINQNNIADIYRKIVGEIGPDVVSPVLMRLTSNELNAHDVNIENYKKLIEYIKKDIKQGKTRGHHGFLLSGIARNIHHFKHRCIAEIAERNRSIMPCFAGILSGVIYEDGNVAPCEIINYSFGNIRNHDYDFKKLWLSLKAKEITNKIRRTRCFCTYECAMDTNIAYNIKNLAMAQLERL